MSEANPNPNTTRVAGELSLDDLSQIAAGTSSELQLSEGANFNLGEDSVLKSSDSMFTAVGAAGTGDGSMMSGAPMNMTLMFP